MSEKLASISVGAGKIFRFVRLRWWVVVTASVILVNLLLSYRLGYLTVQLGVGDGNIYRYIVVNNIRNWRNYSFSFGIPQRMFYPDKFVSLYTDPLYLQSLLFLPVYLTWHDVELLFPTIWAIQVFAQSLGICLLYREILQWLAAKGEEKVLLVVSLFGLPLAVWGVLLPTFIARHMHLIFSAPLTFSVYFFVRFMSSRGIKDLLYAAGFLAFFISANVYSLVFTIYLLGVLLIGGGVVGFARFRMWLDRKGGLKFNVRFPYFPVWFFLSGALLVFLSYWPYLSLYHTNIKRSLSENARYSSDILLSFFVPYKRAGVVWHHLFSKIFSFHTHVLSSLNIEAWNFIGVFFLLFMLLNVVHFWDFVKERDRRLRVVVVCSGIALLSIFVFSGGPYLKIAGVTFKGVHLVFYWLWKYVGVFRGIRVPARIVLMVVPFVVPIYAFVAYKFVDNAIHTFGNFGALGVALGLWCMLIFMAVLDIWMPVNDLSSREQVAKAYTELPAYNVVNALEGKVLLEIPLEPGSSAEGYYLLFLLFHNKYMVNGYSGYAPPSQVIFEKRLLSLAGKGDNLGLKQAICAYPVDIVVVHQRRIATLRQSSLERQNEKLANALQKLFIVAFSYKNNVIVLYPLEGCSSH